MKHKSPQFELPGTEEVFNLAGEILIQEQPAPAPKPDATPEMFNAKGAK